MRRYFIHIAQIGDCHLVSSPVIFRGTYVDRRVAASLSPLAGRFPSLRPDPLTY